jgi:organic hydroperoxide reductase OsmC/OhrA
VTTSRLKVVAEGVQGLDNAGFEQAAKEAESKCPISNALRGNLVIELDVQVK